MLTDELEDAEYIRVLSPVTMLTFRSTLKTCFRKESFDILQLFWITKNLDFLLLSNIHSYGGGGGLDGATYTALIIMHNLRLGNQMFQFLMAPLKTSANEERL